jgi:cysteine desulfurase/selenocysteine lyase
MKKDLFPIFNNSQDGFVYLDNAATTQKPQSVIDSLSHFYTNLNSNIHRSVYPLSEQATEAYEHARDKVKNFINASDGQEIIFTKSTTESINLVAYSWGEINIKEGDEILVSVLEHHSNFLPWQQLAKRKGAILKIIPCDEEGIITIENVRKHLSAKTKIVAITHLSNVTGTILPIKEIIKESHEVGACVLIDAAQSIAHMTIDVNDLNCDWLVFSGHKMYGPTGVGMLYGKKEILESMPPFLFGGGMVKEVTSHESVWADLPSKFEAGTPPIAEVIALAISIGFLEEIGLDSIMKCEKELTTYALEKLKMIEELTILGTSDTEHRGGIISFTIKGAHPHDVASLVGERGICIRAGHHCAEPLHRALNLPASCRISLAIYNSREDIDMLIEALGHAKKTLKL